MASLANETGPGIAARPPISQHRAFPAIVALWFAALLGLGSLILPVALVEQVVTVTGLAELIPATAPPLGMTARALIALTGTCLGAFAGLLMARQVARSPDPQPRRRIPAKIVEGRRPISAHDELGEEGLAGNAARRRALAIEAEDGPSDFLELAPLPGRDPRLHVDHHAHESENDEPLELDQLLSDPAPAATPSERQMFRIPPSFQPDQESPMSDRQDFRPALESEMFDDECDAPGPGFYDEALEHPTADAPQAVDFTAPEPAPAHSDPADSGPQMELPDEGVFAGGRRDAESATTDLPEWEAAEPLQPLAPARARQDEWAAAPLDELGLVQLAQRLGHSLERHREKRAAEAALAASMPPVPAAGVPAAIASGFDMAPPEEAVKGLASFFGEPCQAACPQDEETSAEPALGALPASPAFDQQNPLDSFAEPIAGRQEFVAADPAPVAPAYQPFAGLGSLGRDDDEDEDDLDHIAASFSLPLGRQVSSAPVSLTATMDVRAFDARPLREESLEPVDAPEAEDESAAADPGTAAENYGSLLSLRNPFQERAQDFVRIEDEPDLAADGVVEPAVVFPNADDRGPARPTLRREAPPAQPGRPFDAPAAQASGAPTAQTGTGDPEENDRALREALLNLQRMSGAA